MELLAWLVPVWCAYRLLGKALAPTLTIALSAFTIILCFV